MLAFGGTWLVSQNVCAQSGRRPSSAMLGFSGASLLPPHSWQRYSRIQNVIGIIVALGFCKTCAIWTVAFRNTALIGSCQEVRISAGKGHCTKGIESGANPLAVP